MRLRDGKRLLGSGDSFFRNGENRDDSCHVYGALALVRHGGQRGPRRQGSGEDHPGVRPYTGAFHFAPSRESKNPEAAYWLLRYITSYGAQKGMLEDGGWASVRTDVL